MYPESGVGFGERGGEWGGGGGGGGGGKGVKGGGGVVSRVRDYAYRGTSLIGNTHPHGITIGPQA